MAAWAREMAKRREIPLVVLTSGRRRMVEDLFIYIYYTSYIPHIRSLLHLTLSDVRHYRFSVYLNIFMSFYFITMI